jgi:hypothetical protein
MMKNIFVTQYYAKGTKNLTTLVVWNYFAVATDFLRHEEQG